MRVRCEVSAGCIFTGKHAYWGQVLPQQTTVGPRDLQVMITQLQHTHKALPHYHGKEW